MTHDDAAHPSPYSEWKGWSDVDEFGTRGRGDDAYFTRELREVARHVGQIADVLEIGFGDGRFMSFARSQGWNVVGTEILPDQIAAAQSAGFAVHRDTELDELGVFDVIAVFDVLEHIEEPDAVPFLSALAAHLKPGGAMILRYPNADSWLGNVYQNGDPTHVSAIGVLKMAYLAKSAGLEVMKYREPSRRGFRTSVIHGLHALLVGPLTRAIAFGQKLLYFPSLPVVLSSSNVVCILLRSTGRG